MSEGMNHFLTFLAIAAFVGFGGWCMNVWTPTDLPRDLHRETDHRRAGRRKGRASRRSQIDSH